MGKRSEPRNPVQIQVRIFGTDKSGRIFSEKACTVDVSRSGAKLTGIKAEIQVDEIIGLTKGTNKVHFRVKWVGARGTAAEGQVGVLNLSPERPLWDLQLPAGLADNFHAEVKGERRKSARVRCDVPLELRPEGEANMWGKASDISIGGCFIEMPIPLKPGAKFEIALWIGDKKVQLKGEVVTSAPGFGIGVRFLDVSPQDLALLEKHIATISQQLA
jgi:PilZ domain